MLLKDGVLSAQMTYLAGSTYNRVATGETALLRPNYETELSLTV